MRIDFKESVLQREKFSWVRANKPPTTVIVKKLKKQSWNDYFFFILQEQGHLRANSSTAGLPAQINEDSGVIGLAAH